MLRRLLLAAIVLHVVPVQAFDRVQSSVRIFKLRTEEDRSEWCGKQKRIEACTRIAAPRLNARTVGQDGQWRIQAKGEFIALIGLQDMLRYGHEITHVRDIESSIDSYLASLESASFPTRESCEHARAEAVAGFEARVLSFAEASNLLRHGSPHPDR